MVRAIISSMSSPVARRARRARRAARLREINEEMARLSADVHALSHKLHPSVLDDLGLLVAMEGECNAFSKREKIELRFRTEGVNDDTVRGDVALCVFRVMQEAL